MSIRRIRFRSPLKRSVGERSVLNQRTLVHGVQRLSIGRNPERLKSRVRLSSLVVLLSLFDCVSRKMFDLELAGNLELASSLPSQIVQVHARSVLVTDGQGDGLIASLDESNGFGIEPARVLVAMLQSTGRPDQLFA